MANLTRAAALVGLVLAAGGGLVLLSPWKRFESTASAAPPSAKPPEQEVPAAALTLKYRPLAAKAQVVGTLTSNESVNISSEVQRRVVAVHAQDGARVKKGDVLFELDRADLLAKQNELFVRRKLLVQEEQRKRKLRDEGLGTEADQLRAKSDLDLLDAQAETLRVEIQKTRIVAPFDGRLGIRKVSVGALVAPQTLLVSLEDDSRVKVDFSVPERYAPLVKVGSKFSFRVDGAKDAITGSVSAIEPKLSPDTRTLLVRGVTDPSAATLVTGSSVSVEVELGQGSSALLVPSEAVIPSIGGHSVYTVVDGVAKPTEIEIGLRTEREVQVVSGLSEGDVVLVDNLLRLRPGAKVKTKPSGSAAP